MEDPDSITFQINKPLLKRYAQKEICIGVNMKSKLSAETRDLPLPSRALLIAGERDVSWESLNAEVLKRLLCQHDEVAVLDLSHLSFPKFVTPPRWVRKKWHTSEDDGLQNIWHTSNQFQPGAVPNFIHDPGLALSVHELDVIENSALSLSVSLLGSEAPYLSHPLSSFIIRRLSLRRSSNALAKTALAIQQFTPDVVVIPNGRLPYQKGAQLAALRLNTKVMFYEHGIFRTDHFYFSDRQSHDRLGNQAHAQKAQVGRVELVNALAWLSIRRNPLGGLNQYASTWKGSEPLIQRSLSLSAALFTSSADESVGLEGWSGHGWRDQYEAFDFFLKRVKGESVLRVHPNFLNKSFSTARMELSRLSWLCRKHPDLKVVLPNDPINSYDLVETTERVVVYGSTIGLEAHCIGKSVWNAGNAIYDSTVQVRTLKPNEDYPADYFSPWDVDKSEAIVDLAKLMTLETSYPDQPQGNREWYSKVPAVIRLINLIRSNSHTYVWALFLSWASKKMNRFIVAGLRKRLRQRSQWFIP